MLSTIGVRSITAWSTRRRAGASSTGSSAIPSSEVCWRKIRPGLSAGRVQSPSVVWWCNANRERMAFVAAAYWDLEAAFPTDPTFTAVARPVDDAKVAEGKDFDSPGQPKTRRGILVLDEKRRRGLATRASTAPTSPSAPSTPAVHLEAEAPFITSSLQQVGRQPAADERAAA